MPWRLDNILSHLLNGPRPKRLFVQRSGQVGKEKRRKQRPHQIAHPADNQAFYILQGIPLFPQCSHSQPHRITREELSADKVNNDQSYREGGALYQFR